MGPVGAAMGAFGRIKRGQENRAQSMRKRRPDQWRRRHRKHTDGKRHQFHVRSVRRLQRRRKQSQAGSAESFLRAVGLFVFLVLGMLAIGITFLGMTVANGG